MIWKLYGLVAIVSAVYGYTFRTGIARFYRSMNRKILRIEQGEQYNRVMTIISAALTLIIGLLLICGLIEFPGERPRFSDSDRRILASLIVAVSFACCAVTLLVRKKWTEEALKSGDRFLWIKLDRDGYLKLGVVCSIAFLALSLIALGVIISS
jgi:hypothetical protein